MTIGLEHYLVLSAVLFCIGLYGALTKRNAVIILMCIELMLNAVNISLVAFSSYIVPLLLTGQVFAIFVMVVAAAEVAVGLAIILAIMMTRDVQKGSPTNRMKLPVFIVAVVLLGIMIYTVTGTSWQIAAEAPLSPTTVPLAEKLFSENGFILPVEIAAMLLLAAIVGAIVIAREK